MTFKPTRILACAATISAAMFGLSWAAAQGPRRDLRSLFTHEAPVTVPPGEGLVRLPLSSEVLRETRSDLSDVRLFDEAGNEIPYFIDNGATLEEPTTTVPARALSVQQRIVRDPNSPPLYNEAMVVEVPTDTAAPLGWTLQFETSNPHFVRNVTVLSEATSETIAQGSIFRLPDTSQSQLTLTLPPNTSGRLKVELSGERSYVEPSLAFETRSTDGTPAQLAVPLTEESRRNDAGKTIVELVRPPGVIPDKLRIETTTSTFQRTVRVRDEGASGTHNVLGETTLRRVADAAKQEQREVPLARPRGDRLRVTIENGDSPALDELTFVAIVNQPTLVFDTTRNTVLRFGGARAHAPRYDVQALATAQPSSEIGARPSYRRAELGAIQPNPTFDPSPVLGFLMRAGARIDMSELSHYRELTLQPSQEGVTRLRLGPGDLARARPDLADVRVVDRSSQQWPYLLERNGVEDEVPLKIAPKHEGATSHYILSLPNEPLTVKSITLRGPAQYFDRSFRLMGKRDGREEVIARGQLRRRPEDPGPVTVTFPPALVASLELVVTNGDDAPLELQNARANIESADLFIVAPGGVYTLLIGDRDATAPRYELAHMRDLVLALRSEPAQTGPLRANDSFNASSGWPVGQIVLWAAIVLAVLVLAALTLRLSRRDSSVETTE